MRATYQTNLSSLYEIPIDKPLNIDIGKFLQPAELPYQNGNDLDLIAAALKQGPTLDTIMDRRQKNLRTVLKWWALGNVVSTINCLS